MSLKLTVKLSGVDEALKELNSYKENSLKGLYIYPVFKKTLPRATGTMEEFTDYLISFSKGDFVKEGLKRVKDFTDEGLRESIREVLEEWGQNPPLTPTPLHVRRKLGVGDTPRNIVTGEYIECFGIGFSTINPVDIEDRWVRRL